MLICIFSFTLSIGSSGGSVLSTVGNGTKNREESLVPVPLCTDISFWYRYLFSFVSSNVVCTDVGS